MDSFKYYKPVATSAHVWFKLIEVGGKVVEDYPDNPCYGDIAHGFSANAEQIHVYHDKAKVPYDVISIKRWIADLNEMGFPCFFEEQEDLSTCQQIQHINETLNADLEATALMIFRHGEPLPSIPHNFFVNLYDYEDKNHLFSTLALIRCLTESGICKVPEEYFKLMDDNPGRDKLDACQTAHKIVSRRSKPYDPRCHANTGHMITYDGNGENISKSELFARFAKKKTKLRDKGYLRINAHWNGSNDKTWEI